MINIQTCWNFSEDEKPMIPVIPITIISIEDKKSELFFKVDSGYAGALGITSEVTKKLNLIKMGMTKIMSPMGEKLVPYYQIYVENDEWGLKTSLAYAIETPRLLAGRSLFKGKKLMLDFEENKTCILN